MGEHLTDTDSGVDLKVGVCNWGRDEYSVHFYQSLKR
jgi:hypothetical protein